MGNESYTTAFTVGASGQPRRSSSVPRVCSPTGGICC